LSRSNHAFTLAELLVTMSVLVIVVLFSARLINSASTITQLANKRMDTDAAIRPVVDRMAFDFSQLVKRDDVSYYVKTGSTAGPMTGVAGAGVNDWIAFYSNVSGYYGGSSSPFSVVAYRVNSKASNTQAYSRLERMGKALTWNGVSNTLTPMVFLPIRIEDASAWPCVANSEDYDSTDLTAISYEVFAPDVFRLEYYYLLTDGTLSSGPWADTTAVDGFKKVAAVCVAFAVIDPKSRVLVGTQIGTLIGKLPDFPYNDPASPSTMKPGDLTRNWQTALNLITDMPRQAVSGIHVYERYFYVGSSQ